MKEEVKEGKGVRCTEEVQGRKGVGRVKGRGVQVWLGDGGGVEGIGMENDPPFRLSFQLSFLLRCFNPPGRCIFLLRGEK